jgi:hypothetical protein
MRYLNKLIITLLLSFPLVLLSQTRNEELLDWQAGRRLTWADYKASPDPTADAAATTATVLAVSYNFSSSGFTYKIECRFSKTRSWGVHKTDYILSHEQGHFDIAEIFARKLHKKLSEYQFNRRTYQKDLDKIYDEVVQGKDKMQNDYDRETNHSINKDKQAEWLQKIRLLLEEYKAYADY